MRDFITDWHWDTEFVLTLIGLYLAASLLVFRGSFGSFHGSCLICLWEQLCSPWRLLTARVADHQLARRGRHNAGPSVVATWIRGGWIALGICACLLLGLGMRAAWVTAQPSEWEAYQVAKCEERLRNAEGDLDAAEAAVDEVTDHNKKLPALIAAAEADLEKWRDLLAPLADDTPYKLALGRLREAQALRSQAKSALDAKLARSSHPDLARTLLDERSAIVAHQAKVEAAANDAKTEFDRAAATMREENAGPARAVLNFMTRSQPENEAEVKEGLVASKEFLEKQAGKDTAFADSELRKNCQAAIDAWASLWRARHEKANAATWRPSRGQLAPALKAALEAHSSTSKDVEETLAAAERSVAEHTAAVAMEEERFHQQLLHALADMKAVLEEFPKLLERAEAHVSEAEDAVGRGETDLDEAEDAASIRWFQFLWSLFLSVLTITLLLWLPALIIEVVERWWLATGILIARADPPTTGPATLHRGTPFAPGPAHTPPAFSPPSAEAVAVVANPPSTATQHAHTEAPATAHSVVPVPASGLECAETPREPAPTTLIPAACEIESGSEAFEPVASSHSNAASESITSTTPKCAASPSIEAIPAAVIPAVVPDVECGIPPAQMAFNTETNHPTAPERPSFSVPELPPAAPVSAAPIAQRAPSVPDQAAPVAQSPPTASVLTSPPDKLWVLDPDGAWRLVRVALGRQSIGRDARCAIQLAHEQASSMHAQFVRTATGLVFMDLNSTNGSTLNGHQVREPMALHGGDVLLLGDAEIRVGEEHEAFRSA